VVAYKYVTTNPPARVRLEAIVAPRPPVSSRSRSDAPSASKVGWNLSPRGARTSRATGTLGGRPASATTGLEPKLWASADMLRNNMDAAEYKHIVLGLIFLKYISDAFEAKHAELAAATATEGADPEDPDEYKAASIFWVPREARWSHLKAQAPQPTIGRTVDDAMDAIERENPTLKGVLPKDFARPGLDKARLAQLINLVSDIGLGSPADRAKDILGRVYEYFLAQFASAEGKKGGQFYTPSRVVRVLVEMLAPGKGRVYDPCCGRDDIEYRGRVGDISIYGQESNYTTWRLANMNRAIRGIGANIAQGDSFHADAFPDLKADYVLANPPFNDSDWRGELLRNDKRWVYGTPPAGNARNVDGGSNGKRRPAADRRPACSRRQPTVDGRIRSAGTSGIARSLPLASFTETWPPSSRRGGTSIPFAHHHGTMTSLERAALSPAVIEVCILRSPYRGPSRDLYGPMA
jgi:N-6 DNA Methylase/HsdM N-terminal domain